MGNLIIVLVLTLAIVSISSFGIQLMANWPLLSWESFIGFLITLPMVVCILYALSHFVSGREKETRDS